MQVEKINENNGEVELRITASVSEVEHAFTVGLDAFVAQFGLESAEGETALEKINNTLLPNQARDTITSAVINYMIPFALERENIVPMTSSNVNAENDPVRGEEFSFTVTVLPKPEFELTSYEPVEVTIPAMAEVTELDLDVQVQMLARQYAIVKVDPETGEEDVIIPEVTEEWVKENLSNMGVTSVAQLRDQFRATSERIKAEQFEASKMAAVMEAYMPRFQGEISDKMVAAMTEDMFEAFKAELAQEGMSMMDFMLQQKTDEKQIRASLASQAGNQLIQGFILDAVFRHEDMTLELPDLIEAMKSIAPGREEETLEIMQKSGRTFLLKEGAARMKAANWLVENATINVK